MSPITLVLNPNARRLKQTALSEDHFRAFLPANSEVRLTRNLGELDQLMSNWEHGERTLCFFGGDGSISQGITSFIRHHGEATELPVVLPVRAGTMNMLCNQSGRRESAQQTLENWVVRQTFKSAYQLRPIPTLKVEVEGELPRYGFVFAWGIGYRVLSEYYRRNESPNVMDAAAVATQTFLHALNPWGGKLPLFKRENLNLEIDGRSAPSEGFHSLVAGTIPSLSLGIKPFPPGPCEPRQFQFSANGMPLPQVAIHAPTLLFGTSDQRHLGFNDQLIGSPGASEVCADLSEGFTMDGEIFSLPSTQRVRLSGGPVVKFWMRSKN